MPAGIVGLRHWTVVLETVDEVAVVRDPFGMTVRVVVAPAG